MYKNVVIAPCSCSATASGRTEGAAFQDATYGKGMRVHNFGAIPKTKDAPRSKYCTVCGTRS